MAELFENKWATHEYSSGAPSLAPFAFHKRLRGYKPTPLVSLPGLADRFGVEKVWLKDESDRFGLPAFKILGASWAVVRVLQERFGLSDEARLDLERVRDRLAESPPIRLVAATAGNHGRAVAWFGRLLGVDARIYVPNGSAAARVEAIKSEGAEVIVEGTYERAIARAQRELGSNDLLIQDTALEGYEEIPGWIVEGYSTLFWEIDEALAARNEKGPTLVLVQMGVGSLAHATVAHFRRPQLDSKPVVVGVEPDEAACVLASVKSGHLAELPGEQRSIMAGLNCGRMSAISLPILQNGMNCFVTINDQRAREAMRLLADEGIVSGETGAAGLGGLLELVSGIDRNEIREKLGIDGAARILLVSTEGRTDPESYEKIIGGHNQQRRKLV